MDEIEEEIENFIRTVRASNYIFMEPCDYSELINYLKNVKLNSSLGPKLKDDRIKSLFLDMISCLGDETQKFYDDRLSKIRIIRDPNLKHDGTYLYGNRRVQSVHITDSNLYAYDFASFSHELGHLPNFVNVTPGDFYEYSEALPIFFEYLAWGKIDKEDGLYNFLSTRLNILGENANEILTCNEYLKEADEFETRFIEIKKKQYESYFRSLEFVLQLLDRINAYKKDVLKEIDMYVLGNKNLREVGNSLDIDTDGCKKLAKIAKKASR